MLRASLFVVISLTACGSARSPSPAKAAPSVSEPKVDAQTILGRMNARYRSATTYADEGRQVDVTRPGTPEESVGRRRFRTRWRGHRRLSFEMHEEATRFFEAKRLAIWTPRADETKMLFLGRVEDAASLEEGLAALQGVSGGLTGLVPRWLLEGGCPCAANYRVGATVPCGAGACFEVSGSVRPDLQVSFYVDTTTYALRRYVSRGVITPSPPTATSPRNREPFEVTSTIEFDPVFDAPIAEHEFDIDTTGASP